MKDFEKVQICMLQDENTQISVIIQDIYRTYPRHQLFIDPNGQGKQELFNILVNYSKFNPNVSYCQGMSYIAATILMFLDEEVFSLPFFFFFFFFLLI